MKDEVIPYSRITREFLESLTAHIGNYAIATFSVIDNPEIYDQVVIATVSPSNHTRFAPFMLTDYYLECVGNTVQHTIGISRIMENARNQLYKMGVIPSNEIYYTSPLTTFPKQSLNDKH